MDTGREITLKNLFQKFLYVFKYFISKWLVILIAGIIGGILGVVYAYFSKPTYTGEINFILSNNSSSSSFAGLASQFGINLSGDNGDFFTGDNIMSLMSSQLMVKTALMKKAPEKNETLLNMFCKSEKIDEGWSKEDRTKNAYPFPDDTSKLTPVQDSLFREIYENVTDYYLTVSKPDKNLNIYNVSVTSDDELFSYYLTKYIVDVTSSFYIYTHTKVSQTNLAMLQHEADSLKALLGGAITNAASQTDQTFNLNPAFQVKRSGSQQSQAQVEVLGTAYGEIVKNLELAKVELQKATPLYQVIDEPVLPLKQDKKSKLICLIVGGFLAGLLVIIILWFRRFVMPELKNLYAKAE